MCLCIFPYRGRNLIAAFIKRACFAVVGWLNQNREELVSKAFYLDSGFASPHNPFKVPVILLFSINYIRDSW